LEHLLRYIRETKNLPLRLSATEDWTLRWWIDRTHAVHPNTRGHTGGGLSLGLGFPISHSGKQKLNTRSSTETELVAVDDLMPTILWTKQFLEEQEHVAHDNLIYQDNQAAILLERNGKLSTAVVRGRNILTPVIFCVTDRISTGEVSVDWCPTEDMTGEFWTKPLQGSQFRRMQDQVMGVTPQPKPRKKKPKQSEKIVQQNGKNIHSAAGVRWNPSTEDTEDPTCVQPL
jgi:hypothetical protein